MNLSIDRVRANRNFANKIWNATRFTLANLGKLAGDGNRSTVISQQSTVVSEQYSAKNSDRSPTTDHGLPITDYRSLADRWIESRLNHTISEVTRLFESYQYGEAGRQAYEFLWGEVADWYIETAKSQFDAGGETAWRTAGSMVRVLDQTLRLLHPFIPFVTEDIWQQLRAAALATGVPAGDGDWPEALIIASWPVAGQRSQRAEADFERVQEIVRAIRNARAEYNVTPGRRIGALISAGKYAELVQRELLVIASLATLDAEHVQVAESLEIPPKSASMVAGGVTIALPLADLVDLDVELARLRKELANAQKMADSTAARLANPGFVNNAPENVIAGARQQLAEWQAKQTQIEERLAALEG